MAIAMLVYCGVRKMHPSHASQITKWNGHDFDVLQYVHNYNWWRFDSAYRLKWIRMSLHHHHCHTIAATASIRQSKQCQQSNLLRYAFRCCVGPKSNICTPSTHKIYKWSATLPHCIRVYRKQTILHCSSGLANAFQLNPFPFEYQ